MVSRHLGFTCYNFLYMKAHLFAHLATTVLLASHAVAQTTGQPPVTPPATPPAASVTNNGVIIYELNFKHVAGFNISFWDGGYIIVPAAGGTGSAIFTSSNRGRRELNEFANVVGFYPANTDNQNFTIIALNGGSGTATAPTSPATPAPTPPDGNNTNPPAPPTTTPVVSPTSDALVAMQAFGEVNQTVSTRTERIELRVRVADKLRGMAMATRDESQLSEQQRARDGTSGFIEFAEMNLDLDRQLTNQQNDSGATVTTATAEIRRRLQLAGFSSASGGGTAQPPPTTQPGNPGSGPIGGPDTGS
jgi:hypothetical protein